ncbi:MAG TPA: GNAT family N-acetyltransferase [Sphingomicrobium sp.]|nr:GNAT family N-acetyltransferase [Sphingomicrobium sp.]
MSLSADELAEMARNRGLKLVRSRIRSPKKRLYGKLAISDPKGKPLFGFDEKGRASASPDSVEDYLRNLGAQDWGASLDVPVKLRKRQKPQRKAANDRDPEPPIPPKPQVREARPADAPQLVELMALLGHDVDSKGVRQRMAALAQDKIPQLVATLEKDIVGLIGIHRMVAVHRELPVGRITILVVAEQARKQGIGRMLMVSAEERLRKGGCGMVEVTSNDRLDKAHKFYESLGYKRTSIRLFKKL